MNPDRTNKTGRLYEVCISVTLKKKTFKICNASFILVKETLYSPFTGEILHIYSDALSHIQAFWRDKGNKTIFFPST